MRQALEIYKKAAERIRDPEVGQDEQIVRAIQHFAEESHLVIEQMAAGIELLESIQQQISTVLKGE